MEKNGEQVIETDTEASAGSKEGVVRWVLGISLALAIGLLTIIWVSGALSQPESSSSPTTVENTSERAQQDQ